MSELFSTHPTWWTRKTTHNYWIQMACFVWCFIGKFGPQHNTYWVQCNNFLVNLVHIKHGHSLFASLLLSVFPVLFQVPLFTRLPPGGAMQGTFSNDIVISLKTDTGSCFPNGDHSNYCYASHAINVPLFMYGLTIWCIFHAKYCPYCKIYLSVKQFKHWLV